MARLRESSGWTGGASEERMRQYLAKEHHPRYAATSRVGILALEGGVLTGFIAGHLTRRFGCDGELQWMLVDLAHRGGPTAAQLIVRLADWFVQHHAYRVCVNVEPDNGRARGFYRRHGAREQDSHWMIWPDIRMVANRIDTE